MTPLEVWHAQSGTLRAYGRTDLEPDVPFIPAYPGEPPPGTMYNGVGIELFSTTWPAFKAETGTRPGSTRRYYNPGDTALLVSEAAIDLADKRLPWQSIVMPAPWGQMASGAYDSFFQTLADGIATLSGPVWLCLHHEPKGDGDPYEYVAMNNHAAPILHTAPNLTLAPILNGYAFNLQYGGPEPPEAWYIEEADVLGFDQYNQWWIYDHAITTGYLGTPQTYRPWLAPKDVLYPLATIKSWGKPSAVGEYGVHYAWQEPGKARLWMEDAYQYALDNGCKSLNYFHKNIGSPRGGWKLDDYWKPETQPPPTTPLYPNSERMDQFKINDARPESYRMP